MDNVGNFARCGGRGRGVFRLRAGGVFRLRARYFPAKESTQSSPGLRPRTRGSHFEGKPGFDLTGAGGDLWLCLRSPPAAALRWVSVAFRFLYLEARLVWQQSRGAAVNSLPLGEGGSASAETDEGNAKGFYLSYVETTHLSIAFPSSAPSGRLPSGEGWGIGFPLPGKVKEGAAAPLFCRFKGRGS